MEAPSRAVALGAAPTSSAAPQQPCRRQTGAHPDLLLCQGLYRLWWLLLLPLLYAAAALVGPRCGAILAAGIASDAPFIVKGVAKTKAAAA